MTQILPDHIWGLMQKAGYRALDDGTILTPGGGTITPWSQTEPTDSEPTTPKPKPRQRSKRTRDKPGAIVAPQICDDHIEMILLTLVRANDRHRKMIDKHPIHGVVLSHNPMFARVPRRTWRGEEIGIGVARAPRCFVRAVDS